MRHANVISILLGMSMCCSGLLSYVATPTTKLADQQASFRLQEIVPMSFAGWKIDNSVAPIEVSPEVRAKLNAVYNQTLSRTYVNNSGERIMLSIAYGGDQRGESTQAHRPEFCYTAQGFEMLSNEVAELTTGNGNIPIRRLKAVQGLRFEPITYWLTVGNKPTLPGFGRLWTQISYGFTGVVADGMLVRVSSIDRNESHAFQLQEDFINALLANMDSQARNRLTGILLK